MKKIPERRSNYILEPELNLYLKFKNLKRFYNCSRTILKETRAPCDSKIKFDSKSCLEPSYFHLSYVQVIIPVIKYHQTRGNSNIIHVQILMNCENNNDIIKRKNNSRSIFLFLHLYGQIAHVTEKLNANPGYALYL